jgi:hypothetical protein
MQSVVAGSLAWHPGGSRFAGAGKTATGALFSYLANWESAGRWGVEICTPASRLILKPLEKLQVQSRGRFDIVEVALDSDLDLRFKPGLYRQARAFLTGEDADGLVDIAQQAEFAKLCSTICGETFSA